MISSAILYALQLPISLTPAISGAFTLKKAVTKHPLYIVKLAAKRSTKCRVIARSPRNYFILSPLRLDNRPLDGELSVVFTSELR